MAASHARHRTQFCQRYGSPELQFRPAVTAPAHILGSCEAPSALPANLQFVVFPTLRPLDSADDCRINLRGKCSFFRRICMKMASFTPDLGRKTPRLLKRNRALEISKKKEMWQ